jgi:hypothetical protein
VTLGETFLMPRISILAISVFLVAFARGDWAHISTEELLKKTDLVVVARLTDVREFTRGDTDYGIGILVVSDIMRGDSKIDRRIKLEWSNPSQLACPRVEHRHNVGKSLIWLLEKSRSGGVSANHPWRVISLEEKPRVSALLRK